MIKETLNKIKVAEENALKSMEEAKKEKENHISNFKKTCDKEWENLKIKLVKTESKILEKYRNEAEEENKKIEIRQKQELNAIEKISLKKDNIVEILIGYIYEK